MARTATSKLRARHDQATRDLILDALVELLAEQGGFEFSYFALARRAGISVRTIYRHFPARSDLFDGLSRRISTVVAFDYPKSRDGIVGVIRDVFLAYERNAPLVTAQLQAGLGKLRARGRHKRVGLMHDILQASLPQLDTERRVAIAGLFTCLFSANIWQRLHDEVGLDGAQSGELVAWAVDTLWRSLEDDDRTRRKRGS